MSAPRYRPWSTYNGFRLAYEWVVTDKLLFASRHYLLEVSDDESEGIIERDALVILGL